MNTVNFFGSPSDRMYRFRNKVHSQPFHICMERARIVTDAYAKYEDHEIHKKRALAFRDVLANMTLMLEDDDLLAGYQSSELRACPIFPEYSIDWLIDELDEFSERPGDVFYLTEEQKDELRKIQPFWHGKTLEARAKAMLPEESKRFNDAGIVRAQNTMMCGDGHIAVNFKRLLEQGLIGYKNHTLKTILKLDPAQGVDQRKFDFLSAVLIALDACVAFAARSASHADELADSCIDPKRKDELRKIAEICRRVPEHPATSFYEAIQSIWFIQLLLQIESNGHSYSLGRLDQYLYPYYTSDIKNGVINESQACELLENLWIKLYSINKIRPWVQTKFTAGSPMYENVTIGGQLPSGGCAVNALSYLVVKSVAHMHLTQPNLTIRYCKDIPDDFMYACIELIKEGFGMPAFNNDEIIVPSLVELGVTLEDALDYSAIGCVEVAVPGRWGYRCTGMSYLNFSKMLNVALNGGKDDLTNETIYSAEYTWEDFDSYEAVYDAWKDVCVKSTRQSIIFDTVVDIALEEMTPDILCSALVDDCISRGLSLKQGGAVYDFVSGLQVGIANVGNSLAAIKKLIFEDKLITMQQLHNAISSNFEGAENNRIQQMLLNAPKYGCDDDYVDSIVVDAYLEYINNIKNYRNTRYGKGPIGGTYFAGTSSVSANVPCGAVTGASPDGRKAFTPLAEGCSPSSGTDIFGPTAVFNSVAKLPTKSITGGVLLNQKILPSSLKTRNDSQKLNMLIRTFFDVLNGFHVQYNYVDRAILLDAKIRPENHRNLIVRVAGYSAFFTTLSPQVQDDIINRTEHVI